MEDEIILLEDIVKEADLPIILVARGGLGTINHTILTVEYIKSIGLNMKGTILNEFDKDNIMHRDNLEVIKKLSKIDDIVCIPKVNSLEDIDLEPIRELICK